MLATSMLTWLASLVAVTQDVAGMQYPSTRVVLMSVLTIFLSKSLRITVFMPWAI